MRVQRANTIGRRRFTRCDVISYVFVIRCRKLGLILCWCWYFITILVSQVRKKFHAKFSRCCRKRSAFSLLSIIFIRITEQRWAYIYFQQDGARAHSSVQTMQFLRKFFNDRLISVGLWLLRSPDLTPLDFFLWRHLKNKIFATPSATIEELKQRITMEIKKIT